MYGQNERLNSPSLDEIEEEKRLEEEKNNPRKKTPVPPPAPNWQEADKRMVIENMEGFITTMRDKDPNAPVDDLEAFHYAHAKYGKHYKLPSQIPDYIKVQQAEFDKPRFEQIDAYNQANAPSAQNSYFGEAIKRGGNESITGLAYHIASGDSWYDTDEFDVDGNYKDMDMLQGAISFTSSMVHDAWFFMATEGWGALSYLGGATAKKAAANKAAQWFFTSSVKQSAKTGILTSVPKRKLNTILNKKYATHTLQRRAVLEAIDDPAERAIVERLSTGAMNSGKRDVMETMATRDLFTKGVQKKVVIESGKNKGKEKVLYEITKPEMLQVAHAFGRKSARQLAAYSGIHNFEHQVVNGIKGLINPETGEPYGDSAPNIFARWKEHGFEEMGNLNLVDVLASSMEGYVGGYLTGAFSGLMHAGKAGAWNNSAAYKAYTDKMPKFLQTTLGETGELAATAGIFSAVQKGFQPIHRAAGAHLPEVDQSFGELFVQNLGFFGAHRLYSKINPVGRSLDVVGKGVESLNGILAKKKLQEKGLFDKIASEMEGKQGEEVKSTINERTRQAEKTRVDLQQKAVSIYGKIATKLENFRKGLMERTDWETTYKELENLQQIFDKFIEYGVGIPPALKQAKKEVDKHLQVSDKGRERLDKFEKEQQDKKNQENLKNNEKNKENQEKNSKDKNSQSEVDSIESQLKKINEKLDKLNEDPLEKQIEKASKRVDKETNDKIESEQLGNNESNNQVNKNYLRLFVGNAGSNIKTHIKDVQFLMGFARFLDGRGSNLSNFTRQDMFDYIKIGGKDGKGFRGLSNVRTLRRFADKMSMFLENNVATKDKDFVLGKGQTKESNKEVLTVQEHQQNQAKVQMNVNSKDGASGGFLRNAAYTAISKGKSMINEGVQVLNHLWSHYGSRGTAIRGLKLGDIVQLKNKEGFKITLREKGGKEVEILIKNEVDPVDGVNYYEAVKRVMETRVKEVSESVGKDKATIDGAKFFNVKTKKKQGAGKDFDASDLKSFVENYGGGKITPHRIRHSLLQMAIALDRLIVAGGGQAKWTEFVDVALLNHDAALGMSVVGKEFYSGGKKIYDSSTKETMRRDFFRELQAMKDKLEIKDDVVDYVKKIMEKNKDEGSAAQGDSFDTGSSSKEQKVLLKRGEILSESVQKEKIINWLLKNPGMEIKIEDFQSQKYAGRIVDGVIKLVDGRMDMTTFFHENIHRLTDFITLSGNTRLQRVWRKGLKEVDKLKGEDRAEYLEYVKLYGKEKAAEEYLTQKGAEWSAKWETAGRFRKLGMWGKQLISELKAFIGGAGVTDVARVFGRKSYSGFATPRDIAGNPSKVYKQAVRELNNIQKARERYQKETGRDLDLDPITPETKTALNKELKRLKLEGDADILNVIKKMENIDPSLDIKDLTNTEVTGIINLMRTIEITGANIGKRKKSWRGALAEAILWRNKTGLTKDLSQLIADHLGIPKKSLRYASETQLKQFSEMLKGLNSKWEVKEEVLGDAAMQQMKALESKTFLGKVSRAAATFVLPVDYVLRKFGGSRGAKIGDKLLDHYKSEAEFFGWGNYKMNKAIAEIRKSLGLRGILVGVRDKYAHDRLNDIGLILDPALREGLKLNKKQEDFIERAETDPNSPEAKAVNHIREMYDFYYNSMFKQASNMLSPKEFADFKKTWKKKYIQEYFTRQFTPEAIEHFSKGGSGHERLVKKIQKDIIKQELKNKYGDEISNLKKKLKEVQTPQAKKRINNTIAKLTEAKNRLEVRLRNANSGIGRRLYQIAERQAEAVFTRHPNTVENKYLLERMPKLKNIEEVIDPVTGKEKKIKVYDTNFESTVGRYIRVMSSFLSTMQHFPEFSPVRGKWSQGSGITSEMIKLRKEDSHMSWYATTVLLRRIGLEPSTYGQKQVNAALGTMTRYSALAGLSSPTSGVKNFLIGSVMNIGAFGLSPFLRGLGKSAIDSEARDYATQIGAREIGTKELELSGVGKFWMDNVSLMSRTEAANRIIAVQSGRITSQALADVVQGKKNYLLFPKMRIREAENRLKDLFELNNADIEFIRINGLKKGEHLLKGKAGEKADKQIDHYLDHISHWSHIKTQGATGESMMPIWATGGAGKSLTLFYRIAYSTTANLKKNIIAPAFRGNLMPMLRYTVAGQIAGEALWDMYAWLLGQKNPARASQSFLDRFLANASKVENFGLFTVLANPYSKYQHGDPRRLMENNDMIFQPAIHKNLMTLATGIYGMVGGNDEPFMNDVEEMLKGTIVFTNHLERTVENFKHPDKLAWKNNRQLKQQWYKQSQFAEDDGSTDFEKLHPKDKYTNVLREAWLNKQYDVAANMYWATWYYLYDSYRFNNKSGEYMSGSKASQYANQTMDSIMESLNPNNVPDANGNAKGELAASRKQDFMNYLRVGNIDAYNKAVKLENQYWYDRRQFKKLLKEKMPMERESYFDKGQIINDMFWKAPYQQFFGIEIGGTRKTKQSRRSKFEKTRR